MKKKLFLFLVLCLVMMEIPMGIRAEVLIAEENDVQRLDEIDSIFEEMNSLLVQKAHEEYLSSLNTEVSLQAKNIMSVCHDESR